MPQGFGGDFQELFSTISDSVDGLIGIQSIFSGKFVGLCFVTEDQAQIAEAQGLDFGPNHYELGAVRT